MFDLHIPPAADLSTVIGWFAVLLMVAHLLVWPRNLSKTNWKRVDYIWLGIALTGLVGASASARFQVAEQELAYSSLRAQSMYASFRASLDLYARDNGYVCRTFQKSAFSPPEPEFSNSQQEWNRVCHRLQQLAKELPAIGSDALDIDMEPSAISLSTNDSALNDVVKGLRAQYDYFYEAREAHNAAAVLAKPTNLETAFVLLAPWLLAFAIALRIAKVTGELKHGA